MGTTELMAAIFAVFMLLVAFYEWFSGRSRNGVRTPRDWQMAGLTIGTMLLIQRPLILLVIAVALGFTFPDSAGLLSWLEARHFWLTLLVFFCVEELLHGFGHYLAHSKHPNARWAQQIQTVFKLSHRPHHLNGDDERGQVTVIHTFTNGWLWWLIMPNYWFQLLALYLGLVEVFLWGTLVKGLWSAHTHANWNYDLYFHNHPWAWVRKTMWALAHVITFPTQHHHHHARGRNSAKNLCGTLAIYDWLIFATLAIEKQRPDIYGWRQSAQEHKKIVQRYFNPVPTIPRKGYTITHMR